MTIFWILTGLATALAALLMLAGARRGAGPGVEVEPGRDELAALDRLRARGLLDPAAWAAARAEAGRRILNAAPGRAPAPHPLDGRWILAAAGATALAALGLYAATGAPGLPDQPFARRVEAWAAQPQTLDPAQLAAVVERAVRDRPDDPEALRMLGAARFEAGDPVGAASAFRRVLTLSPDDPQSWARLGESLVRANQGAVGGDAEAAFSEALKRDPDQLGARYFLGEAALSRGEAARVRDLWGPLIAALDPADPRRSDLISRLPQAPR
ncbi:MAG: c-type cytochrome biogenesis protein CcmI [Brevundimonas sp.]|uniref:c-type cytochrome biogenesis protein CcmI n=1 Tax=Brevundimonas sp. TaxID=1871086 RepID=UPI0025BB769A|nr:c-type cytochrome biogenesis protein CcmI [Brevundimonas sp.]MBX3477486.1 c-type cytochrome biogenesis protein CcmI [Brevundimonas sp.]